MKSKYSCLTTLIFLFFGIQFTNVQAEELNQKDIDRYLASIPDYIERSTGLLYIALKFDDIRLLEHAIRAGADVNYHAEKRISTPLCIAAERNNVQHMQALLNSGAEAALVHEGKHPPKQTAINCAVNYGHVEAVDLLLEWGADIARRTCDVCRIPSQGSALQDALLLDEYEIVLHMLEAVGLTDELANPVIRYLEKHVSSYSKQHEEPNRHKLARYMRNNGYEFDLVKCADAINGHRIKCLDE